MGRIWVDGAPSARRDWLSALVAMVAGALALGLGSPAQAASAPGRLPDNASPLRYDLTLIPDAKALTFKGRVHIDVDVASTARTLTLNAVNLDLDKVEIDGAPATARLDAAEQTATLSPAKALTPGHHVLDIAYRGTIEQTARGLFHLDYTGADGAPARMLLTQFEAGEARRFLPCWDEPGVKAVYVVSAAVPGGQTAVSNMPVRATEAADDGLTLVHFLPTPRMSSYLLFLGMGDVERISAQAGNTEIGVITRRGAAEKGRYALESAVEILARYNEYFGTPYPLPKMDMIAAPGAGGFGAMENWGAIMYFEPDLLLDPKVSTEANRHRVFEVVAHEMAHQWFGNLVTMAWWDDLWLNEGFASWMATKVTDMLHPDWQPWLGVFPARLAAMNMDAGAGSHPIIQPITSVAEADEAFDSITYQKGQAVIRMVETTVGEDVFREGVRRYIKRHAFANATTRDLWKAVEEAGGKGILRVAGDFTTKPGLPLLSVDVGACVGTGTPVTLKQSRFTTQAATATPPVAHEHASSRRSADGLWAIPVTLETLGTPPQGPVTTAALIGGPTLKTVARGCGPVVVNAGQTSYMRTSYAPTAFQALLTHLDALAPIDQMGLLADAIALGRQGVQAMTAPLDIVRALKPDADPQVWQLATGYLLDLDAYYSDRPQDKAGRAALRAFARGVLNPVLAHIGWDARDGQSPSISVLRASLISALGVFDDPGVLAQAWKRLNAAAKDPASLPAGLRIPVMEVAARQADEEDFEHLHDLARAATDPLERRQLYMVLAAVRDGALVDKALALSLSAEVATTTTPQMIQRLAGADPDRVWRFTMDHVDEIERRLDQMQRYEFVAAIANRSNRAERAGELTAYAQAHVPAQGRHGITIAADEITQRARIVAERLPAVDAWLTQAVEKTP